MVREVARNDDESVSDSFRFMTMLPLAVATSDDALCGRCDVCVPAGRYRSGGVVHRCNHVCAVVHRRERSAMCSAQSTKSRAELFGGIVLILMGLKILLEHLGFLG